MSDDGEDNTTSPEQRASGRAWPSLAGKTGRSAACGYHAPGRSASMAARLLVKSCGGGEGGKPTRQLPATSGLVEEPVAAHAVGNAAADMRSLPAGLGKTQRPVDRGVGGNRRQSALPCGARRLPPTRPPRASARAIGTGLKPEIGLVLGCRFARSGVKHPDQRRQHRMGTITTTDGTEIFFKDWGSGQPIVFSHGWPLSADDWDNQMLFFLGKGYRVIAHDRRGHGRSTQVADGHDMDHYADDLAALTTHLDLKDAIHVGHSTGGGEVVHYLARRGQQDVSKAAIISAVPPLMLKTDANPEGLPKSVFDDLQAQLAANRSEFYRALPSAPFYGFNRPGVESSEAIIENWWRQGMMGGAKAHYDGIVAFSQTDFTEDLKKITVPVLVMHSEDDQIVPYVAAGPLSAKLLKNGTMKTYKGFPHGMPTTEAETINADLLAFLKA